MTGILLGKGDTQVHLLPRYGNRHGLIAGATGTGKSVSLMVLAEQFSRLGVPVFLADVKGDLAGLAAAGTHSDKLQARLDSIGITDWRAEPNPVVFWDLYGKLGHPLRTTVTEMGPTLLARVLELNDTQSGVLEIVFRLADDNGWLLLDLDDLRSLLGFAAEHRRQVSEQYGLVSSPSIGAIQRASSTCWPPTSWCSVRGCTPAFCSGCCPNCSRTCPRSVILSSPSWCSSSTRPTCCSTTAPRRCSSGWNRWFG
jgi:hypothetical protein